MRHDQVLHTHINNLPVMIKQLHEGQKQHDAGHARPVVNLEVGVLGDVDL